MPPQRERAGAGCAGGAASHNLVQNAGSRGPFSSAFGGQPMTVEITNEKNIYSISEPASHNPRGQMSSPQKLSIHSEQPGGCGYTTPPSGGTAYKAGCCQAKPLPPVGDGGSRGRKRCPVAPGWALALPHGWHRGVTQPSKQTHNSQMAAALGQAGEGHQRGHLPEASGSGKGTEADTGRPE